MDLPWFYCIDTISKQYFRQVMFWAESSQCNSPLFIGGEVAGQVEVPAGQVNLFCTLFSENSFMERGSREVQGVGFRGGEV